MRVFDNPVRSGLIVPFLHPQILRHHHADRLIVTGHVVIICVRHNLKIAVAKGDYSICGDTPLYSCPKTILPTMPGSRRQLPDSIFSFSNSMKARYFPSTSSFGRTRTIETSYARSEFGPATRSSTPRTTSRPRCPTASCGGSLSRLTSPP